MRWLLTGGAGYIGAAVARRMLSAGHAVVVVDNLSTGHRQAAEGLELIVGDFGDAALLDRLLKQERIEGIVHMAASCLVRESVEQPAVYYRNNFEKSMVLLEAARRHSITRFVFSSTAAVYGEPARTPIAEDDATLPTNPYGETKLAFERVLKWYGEAYGFRSVCLRYFNAAGATGEGRFGEVHQPETHLVPIVLRAALDGGFVPVYGTDYPTPDGTAVRDYIHVVDLAEAHRLAAERLERGVAALTCNLGNGDGFSVLEVIEAARRVTGRTIAVRPAPRRAGDPARLVASATRAREELSWSPRHSGLNEILESAWRFQESHRDGYA